MASKASKSWTTSSFLVPPTSDARPNALVILNSPLAHDALFRLLWAACTFLLPLPTEVYSVLTSGLQHQCGTAPMEEQTDFTSVSCGRQTRGERILRRSCLTLSRATWTRSNRTYGSSTPRTYAPSLRSSSPQQAHPPPRAERSHHP